MSLRTDRYPICLTFWNASLPASCLIILRPSAYLLPTLQSGFRPCHTTDTAVLRVLSDTMEAVDRGDTSALVLLDLARQPLIRSTMKFCCSSCRLASASKASLCSGFARTFVVELSLFAMKSSNVQAVCNVPQGSVLGPLLFTMYVTDIISQVGSNGLKPTTRRITTRARRLPSFLLKVTECIDAVAAK